jgi:hypothetical protein
MNMLLYMKKQELESMKERNEMLQEQMDIYLDKENKINYQDNCS